MAVSIADIQKIRKMTAPALRTARRLSPRATATSTRLSRLSARRARLSPQSVATARLLTDAYSLRLSTALPQ